MYTKLSIIFVIILLFYKTIRILFNDEVSYSCRIETEMLIINLMIGVIIFVLATIINSPIIFVSLYFFAMAYLINMSIENNEGVFYTLIEKIKK